MQAEASPLHVSGRRRRRWPWLAAAILLGGVAVTSALAFGRGDGDDDQNQPVQVHLTGALQAIEQGQVSLLYLNDASRRATLVLADSREVYTFYPGGFGPRLTETALDNGVSVLAAEGKGFSPLPALVVYYLSVGVLASVLLLLASLVDRRRVGRGKPSWRASVRDARLEARLGRIEAELSALRGHGAPTAE